MFLCTSLILIPRLGPLGAGIALVSSDIVPQLGVLFTIIARETLRHPIRHVFLLIVMMISIVTTGVAVGAAIRYWLPGSGIPHFVLGCTLWLVAWAVLAAPLMSVKVRNGLTAMAS